MFCRYKGTVLKMSFNVNVQDLPQQAASDKTDLKSPPRSPDWGEKGRGSCQAKIINSTVEQHKPWRFPPEFWDRLSTISLTRSALEELDWRNRGSNHPCSPSPLTPAQDLILGKSKGLSRFARYGSPDLCGLRGYQLSAVAMRSSLNSQLAQSTDPTNTTTQYTKTIISSTHDRNFERHLTENNIHPIWKSQKPDLENVYKALAAPQLSLALPQVLCWYIQ